jgi:hypothetical protein
MNFIGDVAGRFDELQELLKIMPDEETYCIGDLVDRGPKSKEVIEFVMNSSKVKALKGNHEDMMYHAFLDKQYGDEITWTQNGGNKTLMSYGIDRARNLPKDHIDWIKNLPLEYKKEGLLVTHAPQSWYKSGAPVDLWNRSVKKVSGIVQIFGHNTVFDEYRWEETDELYAICIDDSGHKKLTGIHWPSQKIYQVDYIK